MLKVRTLAQVERRLESGCSSSPRLVHALFASGLMSCAPRTAGASDLARAAFEVLLLAELLSGVATLLLLVVCVLSDLARVLCSPHGRCE